ncbi:MAG TPA: HNH endonuclease [Verrucomicrobiae bacterium]|jgi:hypothetical protein
MRCIFCKQNSDACVSIEHIIPESLGNIEHILPKGWVCDSCNNYISLKVEKPFLDSPFGRQARFEMRVPNKKGRVPTVFGMHAQSKTIIELGYSKDDGMSFNAAKALDETKLINAIKSQERGTFYFPVTPNLPDNNYITSRFIAKVGLEVLAHRFIKNPEWNKDFIETIELDELRNYVRIGNPNLIWPFHMRRIYEQDLLFVDEKQVSYEVLHEFDILITDTNEYYAIIAIFGVEFVINLGGPLLDGYLNWFGKNKGQSPLYKN